MNLINVIIFICVTLGTISFVMQMIAKNKYTPVSIYKKWEGIYKKWEGIYKKWKKSKLVISSPTGSPKSNWKAIKQISN